MAGAVSARQLSYDPAREEWWAMSTVGFLGPYPDQATAVICTIASEAIAELISRFRKTGGEPVANVLIELAPIVARQIQDLMAVELGRPLVVETLGPTATRQRGARPPR